MTHGVNACRGALACCICGAAPIKGLAQLLRAAPLPDILALEYVGIPLPCGVSCVLWSCVAVWCRAVAPCCPFSFAAGGCTWACVCACRCERCWCPLLEVNRVPPGPPPELQGKGSDGHEGGEGDKWGGIRKRRQGRREGLWRVTKKF